MGYCRIKISHFHEQIASTHSIITDSTNEPAVEHYKPYSTIMISCYVGMMFVNDQSSFFSIFGEEPVLLPSMPIEISTKNMRDNLDDYANKCMVDIFLSIYKSDYAGDTAKDSKNRLFYEIYKEIQSINMESHK